MVKYAYICALYKFQSIILQINNFMKKLFILSALLLMSACANNQNETQSAVEESADLETRIDALIDADQYTTALELLDAEAETEELLTLKEKTYLNYGLYLEYRDSNVTNMRDKMNNALRQYVKVLRINPENEKAITEIEQILGIYSTFPDRSPDEDVMAELKELGFNNWRKTVDGWPTGFFVVEYFVVSRYYEQPNY